jgi:hypothetical protein
MHWSRSNYRLGLPTMSEAKPITAPQLKRLQTLYSRFAAASPDPRTRSREERLLWASLIVGRTVASFSELTSEEAVTAIARLQKDVPQAKARPKPMDRDAAERHAKDGRWDGEKFRPTPQLASAFDLENIEKYYGRLGWDRETFERWLRSPRSPLDRRSQPQIRTVAQANRVRWGLQRLLKKRGLWVAAPPPHRESFEACETNVMSAG